MAWIVLRLVMGVVERRLKHSDYGFPFVGDAKAPRLGMDGGWDRPYVCGIVMQGPRARPPQWVLLHGDVVPIFQRRGPRRLGFRRLPESKDDPDPYSNESDLDSDDRLRHSYS